MRYMLRVILVVTLLAIFLGLLARGASALGNGPGECRWPGPCPQLLGDNVVLVEDITDFPPAVAGVITPVSGDLYIVNGFVFMGTTVFDTDGNNFLVIGRNNLHDSLIYSGAATFITADAEINSADLTFVGIGGGQFLEYAGDDSNNIVFNGANITGFADLGEIGGVLNFASLTVQWLDFGKGFLFTGNGNGAFFSQSSSYIAASNVGTILDFGSSVFELITLETGRIETFAGGQIGVNGAASSANVSNRGSISDVAFNGPGDHTAGILNSDLRWRFLGNTGNDGTEDSVNHGAMTMQGNATATTISTIDTPVKVAGTWTQQTLSRFTFLSNGRLTYSGIPDIRASFTITTSPTAGVGGNQNVTCYPAKNDTVLSDFGSQATVKAGDTTSITIPAETLLSTTDYLELWCENNTGTTDITAVSGKFIVDGF